MDQPQLAEFKYKHGDRASFSGKRKAFLVASLILALALAILAFPAGLLACIVPLFAYFGGARTLVGAHMRANRKGDLKQGCITLALLC